MLVHLFLFLTPYCCTSTTASVTNPSQSLPPPTSSTPKHDVITHPLDDVTTLDCPRACFCNTLNKIVYCSRRGLSQIPDGIPADSIQLNLNSNTFASTIIRRSNFSRFTQLEHLYLSECGIEKIEVDIFADLTVLKWLDMSNNRIRVIEDYTFRGSTLQHLFLNGNRHIRLRAKSFEGLVTTGLYLHDCSLSDIHYDVLQPLGRVVRYLWLNGNELERIDQDLSRLFTSLQHVRLNSNPLHCDCGALWLKEFFDKSRDTFRGALPPSCLTPGKLKGRLFNQTTAADFACTAPMFTRVEATFNGSFGGLRCNAVGEPPPVLYWVQPSGKISTYEKPLMYADGDSAQMNEGLLLIDAEDPDARLSGMFICIATNSAGNVTFTINLPRPNLVSSRNGFPLSGSQALPPSSRQAPSNASSFNQFRYSKSSPPYIASSFTPPPSSLPSSLGQFSLLQHGSVSTDSRLQQKTVHIADSSKPLSRAEGYWSRRTFTLSEIVGAAVATHICTILLYMSIVTACYWARCKARRHVRRIHQRNAYFLNSNSSKSTLSPSSALLTESVCLNGLDHRFAAN